MRLTRIERAEQDFVTLEDLQRHSVITHELDNCLLDQMLAEALEQVESDTGRSLVETTWQLRGPAFGREIRLPKPPLIEVLSVRYVDPDGETQTLDPAAYQVTATHVGASVSPAPGYSWPAVQAGNLNAVEVNFRAGYLADPEAGQEHLRLPLRARRAILIMAANLYENREHLSPVTMTELPSYRMLISTLEVDLI